MQYYEYLGITPDNYQEIYHIVKYGSCILNIGVYADSFADVIDIVLQVSFDGENWFTHRILNFSNQRMTRFIELDLQPKAVRLFPPDGGDLCNLYIVEYYLPIELALVG